MKQTNSFFRLLPVILLALLLTGSGVKAWGQQTFFQMSTSDYTQNFSDVANWTASYAAGIGATNWRIATSVATSTVNTFTFPVTSTTGGGVQKGTQALVLLATGTNSTATDLLLNFSNREAGAISLDYEKIVNTASTTPRTSDLKIQYSIDNGLTFTDLIGYAIPRVINNATVESGSLTNIALPSAIRNQSQVVIRFYVWNNGQTDGSGNRPKISIDNILVTSTAATPTVATPTFTPPAGTYYTAQNVTLATATDGATIYYTKDGSDPDNTDTEYTGEIAVSSTTTIKARAYADGYDPSAIATAVYTFPVAQTTTLPYTEDFASGVGKIYAYSVSGDTKVWTYNAGGFMNMNGYQGAAVEEDWLVLPGVNLDNYTGAQTLTFKTWYNFGTINTDNYLKLYYSTDYTGVGDPSTATWSELTYTQPSAVSTWTASGDVDLSAIAGTSVYLAFKYRGIKDGYNSWSVDDISIQNPKYAVTFNVDMNGAGTFTNVNVAGSFNSWSTTASPMTTAGGNIYTFTTDAVFNAGDVIEFKFVKDGTTWESIDNRSYTLVAGTNTVNAYWNSASLPQLDWVNLQSPASGTIAAGGTFDVYAQVYEPGVTPGTGQGGNISAWIGYSSTNNDPSTGTGWTWVAATYNTDAGIDNNNDEYTANIGTSLTGGTYYYASRFKYGLNDYVYGGLTGFWHATDHKSGVLTVTATEPTAHVTAFTATANSDTKITITWTDAAGAAGYLIKGSTVSYADIVAPVDGTTEDDGALVKNIASGVQTYQFTGLTASTQYYFKIFPYNGTGAQVNYKVDAAPEASATTNAPPTVLNPGDIAILQVNADTPDRFSFITFVDLNPGTVINFTDNGFITATTVNTNEGIKTYTAPVLIQAGTVLSWVSGTTSTDWTSSGSLALSTSGDQLFAYQGTWDSSPTLIYGVNLQPWFTEGTGGTNNSYLPPTLIDNVTAFAFGATVENGYYSNITSGTINALKSLITYNTNWTTATTDQGEKTWTFALGNATALSANASVFNLLIAEGESFTVDAAKQLTVTGTATNEGTIKLLSHETDGTATLMGDVGGNAEVNQAVVPGRTYAVSSPVTAGTYSGTAYYYNAQAVPSAYAELTPVTASLTPGLGYAVQPATANLQFTGTLNNGPVTIPVHYNGSTADKYRGWNLIGNPYPSALNWETVWANAANKERIKSSVWFNFETDVAYNAAGNVAVPSDVKGVIAPMQGFWVMASDAAASTAITSGDITLDNTMRTHSVLSSNNLLRAPGASLNQIIRLQATNGASTDEMLLYFNPNASDGYDNYDTRKMSGSASPQLYTLLEGMPVLINGMNAVPYNNEITLAFRAETAGTYTIKSTEFSRFGEDEKVILKDKVRNIETDLTAADYQFTADAGTNLTRFSLVLPKSGVISSTDKNFLGDMQLVAADGILNILLPGYEEGARVNVYNNVGQLVATQPLQGTASRLNKPLSSGVYIVTVQLGTNSQTQKLIIK